MVTPSEAKDVKSYSVEVRADDDINYLRDRLSAVTWDVPDDIHERIISRLRSMMGGKVYNSNRTIKLAIWGVDKIRSVDISHS
jgi:hypothetical protein